MLRSIRNVSQGRVGKIILNMVVIFLIVSFGVWGVGDMLRGRGQHVLASVGDTEISIPQFRELWNNRLRDLTRRTGKAVSAAQARQAGVDEQLLSSLMADAALDARARTMKLGFSDEAVAKRIMNDPSFRGPTGAFDRQVFDQLMRGAGYTEASFVAEQRRIATRAQIVDALAGGMTMPAVMNEVLHVYQNETRAFDYIALTAAQAGTLPKPDEEELKTYFKDNSALFRAPEYRKGTLLVISPEQLEPWIKVEDGEIQAAYDKTRHRFTLPEQRRIQQIVFASQEEAAAARTALDQGQGFEALLKQRALSEADVDLGLITKDKLLDKAVADAAFALPANGVSAVVASRFGPVLVRVKEIEAERLRPLPEVSAQLREELIKDRLRADLTRQHDAIEDARAGGESLGEVANRLGLSTTVIEAVDRSGRDPKGYELANLPLPREIVEGLFRSDTGVENDALRLPGGGYVWYEVTGRTPARERSFEEVREQVAQNWTQRQTVTRLKEVSETSLAALKAGKTLATLAKELGVSVLSVKDVQRTTADKAPAVVMAEAFRTANGKVALATEPSHPETYLLQVTSITLPPSGADTARIAAGITQSLQNDLLGQYVMQVQKELGSTINRQALAQITGASQE